MSGKKDSESLVRRIERFFVDNPHEELAVSDMVLKFNAPANSIHTAIYTLRAEGFELKTETVYRAPKAEAGA